MSDNPHKLEHQAGMTLADYVHRLDYKYAHRISVTPFKFRFIGKSNVLVYMYDKMLPTGDIPYLCMNVRGRYLVVDEFTAQTDEIEFLGVMEYGNKA